MYIGLIIGRKKSEETSGTVINDSLPSVSPTIKTNYGIRANALVFYDVTKNVFVGFTNFNDLSAISQDTPSEPYIPALVHEYGLYGSKLSDLVAIGGVYEVDNGIAKILPLATIGNYVCGQMGVEFTSLKTLKKDGKAATALLIKYATKDTSWRNGSIVNNAEEGYSPAACACYKYSTPGTSIGDWYLPSYDEIYKLRSGDSMGIVEGPPCKQAIYWIGELPDWLQQRKTYGIYDGPMSYSNLSGLSSYLSTNYGGSYMSLATSSFYDATSFMAVTSYILPGVSRDISCNVVPMLQLKVS